MKTRTTGARLASVSRPSGSAAIAACLRAFVETRDTRFFFPHGPAAQALRALLELVTEADAGVGLVTAAPGCGKTMLRTELHRRLTDQGCICVTLENAWLDFDGVVLELLSQLERRRVLSSEFDDRYGRLAALKQALLRHVVGPGRHLAILVDEAQQMEDAALDGVRSLTNIGSERRNYITPVLFGQPELGDRVARLPGLSSRVRIATRLRPFTADETADYVRHRIAMATGLSKPPFTAAAIARLHDVSQGVPRVINRQCKLALKACRDLQKDIVNPEHLAIADENPGNPGSWHDSCLLSG